MSKGIEDIRVVVAVDFGTTFSGFAYAHVDNPSEEGIKTNISWPNNQLREIGDQKIPTIIEYDKNFSVKSWGLGVGNRRTARDAEPTHIAELFKLYLAGNKYGDENPPLPNGFDYKKAITDYLREMGKEIKDRLERTWPGTWPNGKHPNNVRFIITTPVEWRHDAQEIMRQCCHKAGFIEKKDSFNLEFTTEPEAAAMHCRELLVEYRLKDNDAFMVVDCGGGTVDLTVRTLKDSKLSEETESTGGCCGGSYVDKAFIDWLAEELEISKDEMKNIQRAHHGQFRKMIKSFFWPLKNGFMDENTFEDDVQLELDVVCPPLKKYVSREVATRMQNEDWCLYLDYQTVKKMFDPVIEQVLELIRKQLDKCPVLCKALLMVGGFSESKYLEKKVRETFATQVPTIAIPMQPVIAVVKGGVKYGLGIDNETGFSKDIHDRVLKFTYGTDILTDWKEGDPPESQKNGRVKRFSVLAKRGEKVELSSKFSEDYYPVYFAQKGMKLDVYYTDKEDAQYLDEVKLLREWTIKLPDISVGLDRSVTMTLMFAHREVKAIATNRHFEEPLDITIETPDECTS